tara:strand:- start:15540 stop:17786 length:2247 start_codon:yes stop_codon:yes gene_type:complete
MSKILANQIANYGDDSPIEIKEGLNIPAGKPIQAAGVAGTSGQFLSSTGTSITWTDVFDGNYNSLTNKPTIPSAQVNADWNATGGISVILNKPVVPALPSIVTAAASSTSSLAYNSANGEFTYTPPDLSSYAQSSSLNSANWDTAYGWGNHASAGYLTSATASSFLSLSDTPSSYTAKAFLGTNAGGTGLVSSPLLFEYGNQIGIGTDNPGSILHLKQDSDAVYMTFDSDSNVPFWLGSYGTNAGFFLEQGSTNNSLLTSDANDYVSLYGAGTKRFETDASGVEITGDLNVTGTITGTGVSASLANLNDTSLGTPQNGQVLKYDGSNWIATTDLVGSGGTGIILSDLSVSTASASSGGSLAYNDALGVFTYTPPDLSGYLTSETDPVFGASAAAGILSSNISNWDAAHGWGNHASAGYLTSETSHADVVVDGDFTSNGLLKRDSAGSYSIVTDNSSNWNTAHGWGDHASAGYLTAVSDLGINATNRLLYQASNGDTDILAAGNSGEVLTSQGDGVAPIWTTVSGGGGASVTIADTAPAATAGDLWWESDKGRLKIYYQDTDSTQWVDVSPPLSQITNEIASGSNKVDFQDGINLGGSIDDNCLVLDPVNKIVIDAHIIPLVDNTYDIGSANRKIRDIYEDQGSDVRIKENFTKFTGGLQFINSLEVATFTYKELEFNGPKAGKRETGLIAQNVKDCLDNSTYESYRLWNENPDSYQGLDKKQLIPALVNAIQELNARVDDLFKELENK